MPRRRDPPQSAVRRPPSCPCHWLLRDERTYEATASVTEEENGEGRETHPTPLREQLSINNSSASLQAEKTTILASGSRPQMSLMCWTMRLTLDESGAEV